MQNPNDNMHAPQPLGDEPLDGWLRGAGVPGLAERVPVLAYGSNACPSKISWLRETLGLPAPVVVLRCTTVGVSAVWCVNRRVRDNQLPAVLAAVPGVREIHGVWLATPEQIEVLDRCEGIGVRYRRISLSAPFEVRTEDGEALSGVQAYVPAGPIRAPMLVDGHLVPLTGVDQAAAQRLSAGAVAGPWEFLPPRTASTASADATTVES